MSTSTRRDAWSIESTAVAGLNGLITLNPDGTSISGPGAGVSDVNIVQIDGTVPSLTIDNLNVQLSHADATPDSVRIGDGTTLVDNDFGVSTASFRVAALLGNAAGIADFDAGATGVQTLRTVLETQSRSNLDDIDTAITALNAKVANDYGVASGAVRTAAQIGNASAVADFNSGVVGAQTLRVVLEDQSRDTLEDILSALGGAGNASVEIIRNDYTGTSVTTGAYVELVASTSGVINHLDIFDSSGETLVFAVGAAAAEVDQFNITPGGNGKINLAIPAASRLSVKAVSATASVGELDINAFS